MTNDEIRQIEQRFNVTLPAEYVALMTDPEAKVSDANRIVFGYMDYTPDEIIKHTLWLRNVLQSYELPTLANLIVISWLNGGDMVLIDTASPDANLFRHDHETLETTPFEMTLAEFVEKGSR